MKSVRTIARQSPLTAFAKTARREGAWGMPRSDLDKAELEAYAEYTEKLRFISNLVERVRMLDYSYIRLCQLGSELRIYPEKVGENPELRGEQNDLSTLEISVLTSFIYNEIKTILDMLKDWLNLSPPQNSELHYLSKIRNFFVSHPRLGAIMRGPGLMHSIPAAGPAVYDITGSATWEPGMFAYYLTRLGLNTEDTEALQKIAKRNEQLIRKWPRNDPGNINEKDIMRMKLLGVRMPSLEDSFKELAKILRYRVLPRLRNYGKKREVLEYGRDGRRGTK